MAVLPVFYECRRSVVAKLLFLWHSCSIRQFEQIHCSVITSGQSHHNAFLLTELCSSLFIRRHPDHHRIRNYQSIVLHFSVHPPTIKLWNLFIRDFSKSSQPSAALLLYSRMRRNCLHPDMHTFPLLLKSFSKLRDQDPLLFFADIIKHGLDLDSFVRNSLISALANSGSPRLARQVFDENPQRDVIAWTSMIDGYVRNGSPGEGLECFLLMRSMGVKADEVTVVSALSAAGSLCYAWIGKWLHGFYVESGRVRWDVFVGSALVDMYMKCGHSDDARQVFDEMPTRNVVSWSCLVAGYVQLGRCKEALLIFQDMLTDNLRPNSKTLTSVLTACAQLGALDQGKWVHAYIDRNLIELNSILGTALIDMYVKCGCINEACFVFDKLPSKGLYTWTAMINGLAMNGDALGSLSFFSRMMCSGVQPNKVTFLGALSACSHGGLVEEGRKLFDEMRDKYHLDPDVDHYGCMVDLLGRAGYLEEAVKLIEEMPMEPSPSIWGALLGACVIHKNLELGEYIGNQLVNLQPDHSGWYSLLANVHLEHRKWDKAASVRKSMKMKGIDKIPGVSWIEVNGLIRDFVTSESLSDWELCEMMDSVWRHIVSSIYDHKVDNFNISGCGEGLKGVVL